jgi:hypothetical protein
MSNPDISPGKQWLLDWAKENRQILIWFLSGFFLGAWIF